MDFHRHDDYYEPFDSRDTTDAEQQLWQAADEARTAYAIWETACTDDDPARRLWLAFVAALTTAERLEAGACPDTGSAWGAPCDDCAGAMGGLVTLRERAETEADDFGLPLPPPGQTFRLPVNTESRQVKAEALAPMVRPQPDRVYRVPAASGPAYHVTAHGEPDGWETHYTCSCSWQAPQGEDRTIGRGCAHALAVALHVRRYLDWHATLKADYERRRLARAGTR